MTDLVPSNQSVSGSLVIKNMEDLSRLSTMLAKSQFFTDAKEASQCGVKVLAGMELGIGAFAAMTGIHIIKGKPTLSANVMAAIVKRSGRYNYRVRVHSPQECQIEFFENGESIGTSSFTTEEARRAGTQNMDKFPRNMLFARAMSNGVRWFCPDVFFGAPVYTPEEMGASTNDQGEVIDVSPVSSSPTEAVPEQLSEIDYTALIEQTNIELKRLDWTSQEGRNYLIQAYGKRSRQLLTDEELIDFLKRLQAMETEELAEVEDGINSQELKIIANQDLSPS
jgi:hypothetical protein